MKFINKTGDIFKVEPENDKFIVVKETEDDINLVEDLESEPTEEMAEKALFKYAQDNFLIPKFAAEIRDSTSLVFQGEVHDGKDAIKLTSDEIVEKVQQYFELKKGIDRLTLEKSDELKEIKKGYDDQIDGFQDDMDKLEPIVRTGFESIEVDVSWERDVDSGMMVLIRRDTLKAIGFRVMDAEEKQKNDLLEPKEDLPVEDVEKETDEVFDAGPDLDDMANDAAPEKESEDAKEQTD